VHHDCQPTIDTPEHAQETPDPLGILTGRRAEDEVAHDGDRIDHAVRDCVQVAGRPVFPRRRDDQCVGKRLAGLPCDPSVPRRVVTEHQDDVRRLGIRRRIGRIPFGQCGDATDVFETRSVGFDDDEVTAPR
jgi:hypothetical protein